MILVAALLGSLSLARPVVFVPLEPVTPPVVERPERPPLPWLADRLEVTLDPGDESRLSLVWTLRPLAPGWVELPLLGGAAAVREATVNGAPLELEPQPDGMQHALLWLDRPATIRVSASLPSPGAALTLPVAPAARRSVNIRGPWEATMEGAVTVRDRLDGGDPKTLALSWRPAGPRPPKPVVLRAESMSALRLDSAGLEGTARLVWRISNGSVDQVRFALPSSAGELQITGDGVLDFVREGEAVRVRLARPTSDTVSLRVSYRAPPAGREASDLPIPWPEASDTAGYTSLLRADEALVAPSPGPTVEAVSSRALPESAHGLAEGDLIASYRLSGQAPQVRARVVVYKPIEGPPTVIDEARYEIATVDHGRLLLRARYQVRNDRRQFLRLSVPEQLTLVSVMVAGRAAQAARDEDGYLLIPLEKSVETLAGLVTFPVDITFYGAEAPWADAGERAVTTPSVDAPIAYARWELVLPPEYKALSAEGNVTRVDAWSPRERGLSYGRSYGTPLVEDGENMEAREEHAQNLWNQAYSAYKEGRYNESKELLDLSLVYDEKNQAAQSLQRNVNVLLDTSGSTRVGEGASARRVRELASAKTADVEITAENLRQQAEEAERAGDLESAEKALEALVVVSGTLAGVEQAERMDRKAAYQEAQTKLEKLKKRDEKIQYKPRTEIDYAPEAVERSDLYRSAAREKRQESMEFLKQIIAERNPQGEQRAEMMFRLAEIYEEEGQDTEDQDEARVWIDKAEKLYRMIASSYPQYARIDLVQEALARIEAEYPEYETGEIAGDELPIDALPFEDLPLEDGQAIVIAEDQQALNEALYALVLDPDIADLLTGADLVWDGDEDLRVEVVFGGFGAYGSGIGGGGTASGYGGGGRGGRGRVSAAPQAVPIPRGGQSLLFEARLVPEGQALQIVLGFERERAGRKRR